MEGLKNLGIDFWSILLYLINFGIIFIILIKYLYHPILDIIDKRRAHIKKSIEEADHLSKEFAKKNQEMEQEKEQLHKKLQKELEQMKKFTEEKKAEMLREMELERAQMLEETQAEIESRKKQLLKDAEKKTLEIIKKAVLYITRNKIPENILEESINDAWAETK